MNTTRSDLALMALMTASVKRGFLDSWPFSAANELLEEAGRGRIDWGKIGHES